MRRLPGVLLLVLLALPAGAEGDRDFDLPARLRGLPGTRLSPLVIHDAELRVRHENVERTIEIAEGLEEAALGPLLGAEIRPSDPASGLKGLLHARTFGEYFTAAAHHDDQLRARREIELEYFGMVLDLLPPVPTEEGQPKPDELEPALRGRIVAALRQRTLDAWAMREAAMDGYLEATVKVELEGDFGAAAAARTSQWMLSDTPAKFLLTEIGRLEQKHRELLDAIADTERSLDELRAKLNLFTTKLKAKPETLAKLGRQIGELSERHRKQRADLLKNEQETAAKQAAYEEARRRHSLEAEMGWDIKGAAGKGLATISVDYLRLRAAHHRLARATSETDHLVALFTAVASRRVERALSARRLAVGDPDAIERLRTLKEVAAIGALGAVADEFRDATIDIGVASLVRRAGGTEDSLLAQNEYFHSLATVLTKKELEASGYFTWTFVLQKTANFGRGVLDLGLGAWDGFFDHVKQAVRRTVPLSEYVFSTKTEKSLATIAVERRKTRDKVAVMEQARTMTGAGLYTFFGLPPRKVLSLSGSWTPVGTEGKALECLREDRALFDATNGGLRRIAAAYDVTIFEQLDSEYLIACERAALTIASLERAEARQSGLDEETKRFSPKILLSPGRMAAAISFRCTVKQDDLAGHIARRKEQHTTMLAMLDTWRELEFDITLLTGGDDDAALKQFRIQHAEMLAHPDYARFFMTAQAIRDAAVTDHTRALAARAFAEKDYPQFQMYTLKLAIQGDTPRTPVYLAPAHLQDAIDHAYQGDFATAYSSLVQANSIDYRVVPTTVLRTMENELGYLEARDTAIGVFSQIADQAFYAALSAYLFPSGPTPQFSTTHYIKQAIAKGGWEGLKTYVKGHLSGLAGFAMQQVNPFAMILNRNALFGGQMTEALWGLGRAVSEGLTREALRDGLFLRYMDPEYADSLANILVDMAFYRASFLQRKANRLQELNEVLKHQRELQKCLETTKEHFARTALQSEVIETATLKKWEAEITQLHDDLRVWHGLAKRAGFYEQTLEGFVAKAAEAERTMRTLRHPSTPAQVLRVVSRLRARLEGPDGPAKIEAELQLWRILDFDDVSHLVKQILKTDRGRETLVLLDNARRNILTRAVNEFHRVLEDPLNRIDDPALLREAKQLPPDVLKKLNRQTMGLLYTGSSGMPDGREYKRLKSDIDVTLLVQGLDQAARNFMKRLVDHTFRAHTARNRFPGFDPSYFEINIMVDSLDLLVPTGFKAWGPGEFADQVRAALAGEEASGGPDGRSRFIKEVTEQMEKDLVTLRENVKDPEKYLTFGRLRALAFLSGISGVIWTVDPATGQFVQRSKGPGDLGEIQQKLQNARLEKWMSLDIMLDDLSFLRVAQKKYDGGDTNKVIEFTDKLAKYGIRVLLGSLCGHSDGLVGLNDLLLRPNGADHGDICDVALRLAAEGKFKLSEADLRVIEEWRDRKLNTPLPEILARRMGGEMPDPASNAFRRALDAHVADAQSLVSRLIGEGLKSGCGEVASLNREITRLKGSSEPSAAELLRICEGRRDRILLSYAAAWSKPLSDAERAFVSQAFKDAGLDVTQFEAEVKSLVASVKSGDKVDFGKIRFPAQLLAVQKQREEEERRRREKEGK